MFGTKVSRQNKIEDNAYKREPKRSATLQGNTTTVLTIKFFTNKVEGKKSLRF